MLIGIGIDILSLSRFQALIQRRTPHALAKRICSPTELVKFSSLLDNEAKRGNDQITRFLSTRWVLKEAAYKSISSRYPVGWKDLQVDHLRNGQPTIRYTPPSLHQNHASISASSLPPPSTSIKDSMCRYDGMESHLDLICTLSHDAGVVVGVVIAQTTVL